MRSILIITQKVDERDDLLGFFVDWLREFARHCDQVHVIALGTGAYDLPPHVFVHSLGKEKNAPRWRRLLRFFRLLWRLAPSSDGIFAHMSPIFVIASWPVAFLFHKKIILWYLHRSVTIRLRIAEMLSHRIVTATRESLRLKSGKIMELGHGINIERFSERGAVGGISAARILSVGRISPIKHYETLIDAVRLLEQHNIAVTVTIIGKPVMRGDVEYETMLKERVSRFDMTGKISFGGFVPYAQIHNCYQGTDIVVNLTPTGGIDKVVLEAMAAGCLVLVSNDAFRKYFGQYSNQLIFKHDDPQDLAHKVRGLLSLSPEEKEKLRGFLINIVQAHHNITSLIPAIVRLYE
ncbi:MAG: glycosyltransferase family 4 protein [Patescibacteria group bacterium]